MMSRCFVSRRRPLFILTAAVLSVAAGVTVAQGNAVTSPPGVYTLSDPPGGFKAGLEFEHAPAGLYRCDPQHSHLIFQMPHYGGLSRPVLRFSTIQAEYQWDPSNPEKTHVEARIPVSSFQAGDRDFEVRMQAPEILRGFDSSEGGKYRTITFKSKEIHFTGRTPEGRHKGTMTGDLTLLGVTKPITLNLVYNGFIQNRIGYRKMGFSATGTFDRTEFGMTSVPSAGKQVAVQMELEFMHAIPGPNLAGH